VVKREAFVPAAYTALAFVDTEIPLPGGQSMLMPKFEARMLQEASVQKHETVLEIGSGSGYMAALLSHRARHVTTIEIDPALHALAQDNLHNYGTDNVDVILGDGARGWASTAPYDVIVISASVPVLPQEFLAQIKIGGRVLCVVGDAPAMSAQVITRVSERGYDTVNLFETVVKPLRNALTPSLFKF
jgi:protein-L-isoaspartate(D-aspartate) O-methyltransferase